jgi:dihydrodipicolinate synthase/N-acetylneuraminate lyase
MWQPFTDEMALRFYETISQAFPDLALMVYGNPMAFRYEFPMAFWQQLVDRAPTAVCAKFGTAANYEALNDAVGERINFMPMDMSAYACAAISQPTVTACWTTAAGMGPQPSIALMDAIRANDMATAKEIADDISHATETFLPPAARAAFAHYNIQLEKLRIQAAGYSDPGPIRPPYDVIPEDLAEGARECGRRWSELVKKYSD